MPPVNHREGLRERVNGSIPGRVAPCRWKLIPIQYQAIGRHGGHGMSISTAPPAVAPQEPLQERPITQIAGRWVIRAGVLALAGAVVLFILALHPGARGNGAAGAWAGVVVLGVVAILA